MADISSKKVSFLGISRELHFTVCNYGKSYVSLYHDQERRTLLESEKGSWESYSKQSPWLFIG